MLGERVLAVVRKNSFANSQQWECQHESVDEYAASLKIQNILLNFEKLDIAKDASVAQIFLHYLGPVATLLIASSKLPLCYIWHHRL